MPDWEGAVIDTLGKQLSEAIGLRLGQSGEAFEEIIGAFLSWVSNLHLTDRFLTTGNHPPGGADANAQAWLARARQSGERCRGALHQTLYRLFGANAVDRDRAASAYQLLLGALFARNSVGEDESVVFATTNYDPSIELALSSLGYQFNVGRETDGITTPQLRPAGLAKRASANFFPVLHLHGAVGWYRHNGRVEIHGADQEYNPSLGEEPALLLPDPEKDPARDAGVAALWNEFDEALKAATHVLVAGHSLNDKPLVDAVRRAMERGARVGVTTLWTNDGEQAAAAHTQILSNLQHATVIPAVLGPDLSYNKDALQAWRSGDGGAGVTSGP